MMSEQIYKSPRKVEEELKQYQRNRSEAYMQMVDDGTLTRALGLAALTDEMESGIWEPSE